MRWSLGSRHFTILAQVAEYDLSWRHLAVKAQRSMSVPNNPFINPVLGLPDYPRRLVRNDLRLRQYPRSCLFEPGDGGEDRADAFRQPGYQDAQG